MCAFARMIVCQIFDK